MNDVLGIRDVSADPVVRVVSYGRPSQDFVRVEETYESIPYSGGKTLIKRVVVPRAPLEQIVITTRIDGASAR